MRIHSPLPDSNLGSGGSHLLDYVKPWLSWSDQLMPLINRGLVVKDRAAAMEFLSHVNYYRFSGYCLAFERTRHEFMPHTTFEQVRSAYDFDRALRDLVTEALEMIEVDVRTTISHYFGKRHGAFGHIDPTNFFVSAPSQYKHKRSDFNHTNWLATLRREADRSQEKFIEHFKNTYMGFPDLPVWMATEIMSFGSISRMYQGLLREDGRVIAHRYGVQPLFLASWLHHLVYVRNVCAHHSRLWDRVWAVKPDLPPLPNWSAPLLPNNEHIFVTLLILRHMLKRCLGIALWDTDWKARVQALLNLPPIAANAHGRMGLSKNWALHPLWM